MYKLYKKDEVWFAILWIVLYCAVGIPIRGKFGDDNIVMLAVLTVMAIGATAFIKKNHLEEKYGLNHWPANFRRYLYFIPMWILATGNLWGGFSAQYTGISQLWAILSMLLVGYVEEVIFRGFLFKAMAKDNIKAAIIVSAVTFGVGHIVNLFTGQAILETVIQILFAISGGFMFTVVFYKSKSLWPGIIAHGLVDVFSLFARENITLAWIYMIVNIIISSIYCIYLLKLPDENAAT